jgi:hypothetical protein
VLAERVVHDGEVVGDPCRASDDALVHGGDRHLIRRGVDPFDVTGGNAFGA